MANQRDIVLGVTGSISAYKALVLTRLLVEADFQVYPVLTTNAERFVGALSFSALSGHRALTNVWSAARSGEITHVELAARADAFVIAPVSAESLARLALGRADDGLGSIALATQAPWILAPAMESGMWENPITQGHVETLVHKRQALVVPPTIGTLASGRQGVGRLAEPDIILQAIKSRVKRQDLAGKKVLVTAGPTREMMDPVRFVSNRSSGKMGFALAEVARRRGANVRLISGPVLLPTPWDVDRVDVNTTQELLDACLEVVGWADAVVMAAAPVDYRPQTYAATKLKKGVAPSMTMTFETTPDVLAGLHHHKGSRIFVGFAAETNDLLRHAQAKLSAKNLDMIVANDVTRQGAGFDGDTNAVEILRHDGAHITVPVLSKDTVAERILDEVVHLLTSRA